MKKEFDFSFLFKIIGFIVLVFVLDHLTGSILDHYYFKQKSGFYYRTTYALNKTHEELLIFGSSKATHQYYPETFEKRLNLSYYNVGRDGSSIFYQYAVLKSVLKRYKPKLVILDVAREFVKSQESYDRISMLLPYYRKNPEIRPIVELKSPYEKYKFCSRTYPYNSLLFSILSGNLEIKDANYTSISGYVPLKNVWESPIQTIYGASNYEIDSLKVKTYKLFIEECKKANIKLYIISSPHFYLLDKVEKSRLICKSIAKECDVKFLDFTGTPLFLKNNEYFADVGHLNHTGAVLFTEMVVDEIVKDSTSLPLIHK